MKLAKKMWVLAANASNAKLYETDGMRHGRHNLKLIEEFSHKESREKVSDIVADRVGHYQSRNGGAHGSFSNRTDPKTLEAETFASELAQRLNSGLVKNSYENLVVIAAPRFHELLKSKCPREVNQLVVKDINKDYTNSPVIDLQDHLKVR